MKSKIKLMLASLLLLAFLAESCGGSNKTPYSKHRKGKHSSGGKRIKTDMGGYL